MQKNLLLWLACVSSLVLMGCGGGDEGDFSKLGFSSLQEMEQIQAQGWRTKQRYEQDRRDDQLERMLVTCYGPFQHDANVAQAKGVPTAMDKARQAGEMRKDLVGIWKRKGFEARDADERAHSIYIQYPPARPEFFIRPEIAKMAHEAERSTLTKCRTYAEQDPAYFKDLMARVARAGP